MFNDGNPQQAGSDALPGGKNFKNLIQIQD